MYVATGDSFPGQKKVTWQLKQTKQYHTAGTQAYEFRTDKMTTEEKLSKQKRNCFTSTTIKFWQFLIAFQHTINIDSHNVHNLHTNQSPSPVQQLTTCTQTSHRQQYNNSGSYIWIWNVHYFYIHTAASNLSSSSTPLITEFSIKYSASEVIRHASAI